MFELLFSLFTLLFFFSSITVFGNMFTHFSHHES